MPMSLTIYEIKFQYMLGVVNNSPYRQAMEFTIVVMIALGLFSFDPSPFHSGSYTVEILAKAYMYKLSYPSTNPYTHMRTKYAEYPSVL